MRSQEEFFSNSNAVNSDSTMQLILNPNDFLKEIELFLKGYYTTTVYDQETGTTSYQNVKIGEPKANSEGVNALMVWLRTKFSPLISMGNISTDQYGDMLSRTRTALARNLMIKRIDYGISLSTYTELIDIFMESFEAYFTSSIRAGHRTAITRNTSVESKEVLEKEKSKLFGMI